MRTAQRSSSQEGRDRINILSNINSSVLHSLASLSQNVTSIIYCYSSKLWVQAGAFYATVACFGEQLRYWQSHHPHHKLKRGPEAALLGRGGRNGQLSFNVQFAFSLVGGFFIIIFALLAECPELVMSTCLQRARSGCLIYNNTGACAEYNNNRRTQRNTFFIAPRALATGTR